MALTKVPLMAELVGDGATSPTQKLDDVKGGVGSVEEPGFVEYVATRTVLVKRLVLSNHDHAAAFSMNGFAGISLTNGFKIVKITAGGEASLIGETTLRNYSDFVEKGFQIERDVSDADWFQLVLDFQEACGTYIKLRAGEKIRIYNQDDISSVSHVAFSLLGFVG